MGRVWIILAVAAISVLSRRKENRGRGKRRAALPPKDRPAASPPEEKEAFVPGEGESRQCEHGLAVGSIQEDAHEGEAVAPQTAQREPLPAQRMPAPRPRLNARELRRAVVTAEILKRPCERGRRFL